MTQPAVPILMYHQVMPKPIPAFARYTVTPQQFARQMQWLAWAGYTPITLDRLYAARTGSMSLPQRPVVITFDDGFHSCVDYALPILQARNFTAVFFLVAGLMGSQSEWLGPELGFTFPLIDWATARQLKQWGFQCGAHTLSHPRLAEIAADRCQVELAAARQQLADQLGYAVYHLAYPYGSYNATVRALAAEAGYQTACSTRRGLSPSNDDQLALQRVSLYGTDSLLDFIWRVRTSSSLGESLRRYRQSLSGSGKRAALPYA